jgi:hypothetical protein
MKKYRSLYLILSVTIINLVLFGLAACNQTEQGKTPEDEYAYDQRIGNLIPYLKEQHEIEIDTCTLVLLLQTSKCGSCTIENLAAIKKELASGSASQVIFILSGSNEQIQENLSGAFPYRNARIVVDTTNQLRKYGLLFLQNLKAEACQKGVQKWSFY